MKNQQVSVDFWAMGKAMVMYGFLTLMGWVMLRLYNTVFLLPRRLRDQNQNMQKTLEDLQKRFPGLDITEEDLKNAEKELEEYAKEMEDKKKADREQKDQNNEIEDTKSSETPPIEDKKTI